MRRFTVIVNPAAGGGRGAQAWDAAELVLREAGAELEVILARDLDHARSAAGAAGGPAAAVVAVGGDGLVGALAGALQRSSLPLGIVPGGRQNDFARALGVPLDPGAAAQVLLDDAVRLVDVAEANGRPFVGIALAGLDSDVSELVNAMRRMPAALVYPVAALRGLRRWRHARFRVAIDGKSREMRGFAVGVGSSGWCGGGMHVLPAAVLDDGRLDVFLSAADSKLRFLRDIPRRYSGAHVDSPGFEQLRAREVVVDADRPIRAYADGEPIGTLPLTVRIHPSSLRVLAPATRCEQALTTTPRPAGGRRDRHPPPPRSAGAGGRGPARPRRLGRPRRRSR